MRVKLKATSAAPRGQDPLAPIEWQNGWVQHPGVESWAVQPVAYSLQDIDNILYFCNLHCKMTMHRYTHTHKISFFIIKPTRCTNFTNLFCHETLHVSDSSSVHHQEFIHCTLSNGICHRAFEQDQDGTAVPSWSCSKAVYKPV